MAQRIWLDVPYSEKDEAKAAGARWDPAARRWYAPSTGIGALQRWAAAPDVPELLPGEDRSFGQGLFVDLVPSSCWFTNVRSCVVERDWERLRRMITGRAGQRCEACSRPADRNVQRWLECHERWEYLETERVQRLKRLVCLCTDCHRTTHFGLAQLRGQEDQALKHLMSVTGKTRSEARQHVDQAFALWQRRSAITWELDLSMLTTAGIGLKTPPEAKQRNRTAEKGVRTNPLHPKERHRDTLADPWGLDLLDELDVDVPPGSTINSVTAQASTPPPMPGQPKKRRWWPFARRDRG